MDLKRGENKQIKHTHSTKTIKSAYEIYIFFYFTK